MWLNAGISGSGVSGSGSGVSGSGVSGSGVSGSGVSGSGSVITSSIVTVNVGIVTPSTSVYLLSIVPVNSTVSSFANVLTSIELSFNAHVTETLEF